MHQNRMSRVVTPNTRVSGLQSAPQCLAVSRESNAPKPKHSVRKHFDRTWVDEWHWLRDVTRTNQRVLQYVDEVNCTTRDSLDLLDTAVIDFVSRIRANKVLHADSFHEFWSYWKSPPTRIGVRLYYIKQSKRGLSYCCSGCDDATRFLRWLKPPSTELMSTATIESLAGFDLQPDLEIATRNISLYPSPDELFLAVIQQLGPGENSTWQLNVYSLQHPLAQRLLGPIDCTSKFLYWKNGSFHFTHMLGVRAFNPETRAHDLVKPLELPPDTDMTASEDMLFIHTTASQPKTAKLVSLMNQSSSQQIRAQPGLHFAAFMHFQSSIITAQCQESGSNLQVWSLHKHGSDWRQCTRPKRGYKMHQVHMQDGCIFLLQQQGSNGTTRFLATLCHVVSTSSVPQGAVQQPKLQTPMLAFVAEREVVVDNVWVQNVELLPDIFAVRVHYFQPAEQNVIADYSLLQDDVAVRQAPYCCKPDTCTSTRLTAPSSGGVQVPITLAHAASAPASFGSAPRPLLLHVYGAYGEVLKPLASPSILPLLGQGWFVAHVHVRGGGELGPRWHKAGSSQNKRNSIDDLIAAAQYLIEQGITTPQQLCLTGASAAGWVIGAALNEAPDLFAATVLDCPALDPVGNLMDDGVGFQELGLPLDGEDLDLLRSWAPYDNIKPQKYPHMLIRCTLMDPIVNFWDPLKYVSRLRAHKLDSNLLLFLCEKSGGHARFQNDYDEAVAYAFFWMCLGLGTKLLRDGPETSSKPQASLRLPPAAQSGEVAPQVLPQSSPQTSSEQSPEAEHQNSSEPSSEAEQQNSLEPSPEIEHVVFNPHKPVQRERPHKHGHSERRNVDAQESLSKHSIRKKQRRFKVNGKVPTATGIRGRPCPAVVSTVLTVDQAECQAMLARLQQWDVASQSASVPFATRNRETERLEVE